jgi:2-polyprenyl-3-methyl-5-hydroxy-6-metoxy-1,4-benzoquinol methylase
MAEKEQKTVKVTRLNPTSTWSRIDNKIIYNTRWHEWAEMKTNGPMSRHTRRLILRSLRSINFQNVLDVGCGPGAFLMFLNTRFPGLLLAGTDISETAISLTRRKLPNATFQVGDITSATPKGRYDLVTMIDVAEHIEKDLAAFENIRSCCRGHLLVSTLEGRMRPFEVEVGHVRNYVPGELAGKLETAGFEIVSFRRWGWPFYSPLYRNLNNTVKPHNLKQNRLTRLTGVLAYGLLSLSLPFRGDLVIALARPKTRNGKVE